ncbi:putative RNA-directed DNA polymerase [Helianthus annuus]|nr:putative RNA-directed DNA polymerase [Helianthus annuus]
MELLVLRVQAHPVKRFPMGSIGAWNIRGLNHSLKQKEVRQVINENHLQVCAILETHVDVSNVPDVCRKVCSNWQWHSNANSCVGGTRIMVGWDDQKVDVMILAQTNQVIHTQIIFKLDKKSFFCSFVYAENHYRGRRMLWDDLRGHHSFMRSKPWVLMGDFNATLAFDDTYTGSSMTNIGMREFKDCVNEIDVFDINNSGFHYTWTNKQKSGKNIFRKLDRVLGNVHFTDVFPNAGARFMPFKISDHTPCVLILPNVQREKAKPFKFVNLIADKRGFLEAVKQGWETECSGHTMYKVVSKLKALKRPLRKLLYSLGNLHDKVVVMRKRLEECQLELVTSPGNDDLLLKHENVLQLYKEAVRDEAAFLQQKSKVDWLSLGDSNTKYFHNIVKTKNHRSRIFTISNAAGQFFEGSDVPKALVDHYMKFFGTTAETRIQPAPDLFVRKLSVGKAELMVRNDEEIKNVMFSIAGNKAPGPDGYTSVFFKKSWHIVGEEVCKAVREFFINGRLLQELNHTVISLIPKVPTPALITDFRPISCCNTIYKCISKIISNRIKDGLGDIVSINQSAFVPSRRISDNILLTQELMHNYHRKIGPPRCAFKVDIQKAYDTVEWKFLEEALVGFGFHAKMVKWVMACVSSTSFSIAINGNMHGYFKGRRGLRQGDPMSPYLFTLVMEVLTLVLQKQVVESVEFRFHAKCEKQRIINLCFADDLFLFTRGDPKSARAIMESLDKFKDMSGLVPSLPKSTVFFGNVSDSVKARILAIMPFEEGVLPVKYLGVPLISSRLYYKDCKVLVDRMEARITDWKNKSLSFAGRLQLIRSVLSSLHVYWASVFILPKRIINDLEDRMRRFLWAQGNGIKGKAKVKWKTVCLPKSEGGLGIRRIGDMNKALMVAHIWSLLVNRESLWVKWIHAYRIRDRNFWDVPVRNNITWSWRKMLGLRQSIRNNLWVDIGDGVNTSVWFDKWEAMCPLGDFISPRTIANAGLHMNSCVADCRSRI